MLQLNGRDLLWVDVAKHLGCKVGPNNQGLTLDLMEKRAKYINRVNELKQEFSYAHPLTKIMTNKVHTFMGLNCGICLRGKLLDLKRHGTSR